MDGMRIILDTRGRLMEFNDEKEGTVQRVQGP
jgi:hypothetical protein